MGKMTWGMGSALTNAENEGFLLFRLAACNQPSINEELAHT
jgi:hypothetical protein